MKYRFDPTRTGAHAWLPRVEADILEVLWQSQGLSSREVAQALGRSWATIATTMNRMMSKGLLVRKRHRHRFLYFPCETRREFLSRRQLEVERVLGDAPLS
jgi:predicted transcriptional regulator